MNPAKPSGKCDYFWWAGPALTTPSSDTPLLSSLLLSSPLTAASGLALVMIQSVGFCRHVEWKTKTDCKSSRMASPCGHSMCKRQCRENGGCMAKGHVLKDNPQRAIPSHNSRQPLTTPLPVSQWCANLSCLSTTSTTAISPTSTVTWPASISSMTSGDDGDIVIQGQTLGLFHICPLFSTSNMSQSITCMNRRGLKMRRG